MRQFPVIALALASSVGAARADVPRCSQVSADLTYAANDLPNVSGDTGWFPGGSPAQLRLEGQIAGKTTVALALTPTACWSDGMKLTAPGTAQDGQLDSDYGAGIQLYGQINADVLLTTISWSHQIPLPYSNFLLAASSAFDGTALPGSSEPTVTVTSPPTSPVTLISASQLTGDLINIVGISGGLYVAVQGEMTTTYSTTSITLGAGAISNDDQSVSVDTPAGGFGPKLSAAVSAAGVVHYEPSLIFSARFGVTILGVVIANWEIASISMPLPTFDRNVTLTATDLEIPLPHLDAVPTTLGFASGAAQTLTLHNSGEAAVAVEVSSAPDGVTAQAATIAPGADGTVDVSVADPTKAGGVLVLSTNDPNHPQVSIALDGSQSGQSGSGSDAMSGELGGCSAGGATGGPTALVLALAAMVRRRRARV